MAAKTVFLCETNHDDHAQRLLNSLIVQRLIQHGYNKLIMENPAFGIENMKASYRSDIDFNALLKQQLFRIFNTASKCENDSQIFKSYNAPMSELIITAVYALSKGVNFEGFEDSNFRENFVNAWERVCISLSDETLFKYFGPNVYQTLKFILEDIYLTEIKRDDGIIEKWGNIYDQKSPDTKLFFMAGVSHCRDLYSAIEKNSNENDDVLFVNLNSNLIFENAPQALLDEDTYVNLEYICGKSRTDEIYANFKSFNLNPNTIFGNEEGVSPSTANDFANDSKYVVNCEINVSDLSSYDRCLHDVMKAVEAA